MSEKNYKHVNAPEFGPASPQSGKMSMPALIVAGVIVLALLAVFVIVERGRKTEVTNTVQPLAAYAVSLPVSGLQMSQSANLLGGSSTFLDGVIHNAGEKTVTAATVQVIFRNDEGLAPQVMTMPLTLIRTRVPAVDTQTVAAAPLRPGDEREFRLIFESIAENWNRQMPEVRIISVQTR
ncbi:MAG: DUF2393 domain-containing protein [Acidobacteriaceae bacterium]|nr:DUF2393 domain-containing protein [Acidobacteriaceae bacterium]